jgi:PAT family beta-lactamase induction signal transducer AmpG
MPNLLKILKDYRLFEILILGIISGMPLALLYSTIGAWCKDSGLDIAIITTFVAARLPYSFKPFWAPFVDYFKCPGFKIFGHRKGWLIFCSSLISLIIFIISFLSPTDDFKLLYILTILLGFTSATFDIVVDAFRIEKFDADEQGIAGASAVLGYRIGCTFIIGAGSLYLSDIISWTFTFFVISILFAIGALFIITIKEKYIERVKVEKISLKSLFATTINPLKDLLTRDYAIMILATVMFFKLGDAMLGSISTLFYMDIGYSKMQIAIVAKTYGFFATLFGSFLGGIIVYKFGNFKALMITGIIQSLTHFAFLLLNHQEIYSSNLLVAISIENLGCAMGSTALVSYISYLCNKQYSATQYAFFSSIATLFNNSITIYSGSLVMLLGWDYFFVFTVMLAIPGLFFVYYLHKKLS